MDLASIPHIKLANIKLDKINVKEGYTIYDIETNSYYEFHNGSFEKMIEEEEVPEPEIKTEVIKPDPFDPTYIKSVVSEGNKIKEATLFMRYRSILNELIAKKKSTENKINYMFDCSLEVIDIIQSRTTEVTEEALRKASLKELKEFFIVNGEEVKLNFDFDIDDRAKTDAYRDYLLYLKATDLAREEIDDKIKVIKDLIENFSEEIREKSKNLHVWDNYLFELFTDKLKDPNISEDEKKRIKRLIEIQNGALELTVLKDFIKSEVEAGRKKSLIFAFKTRFQDTLKAASSYAEGNKFHLRFNLIDNIEKDIDYKDYKNLFIYIFARYVKYNNKKFGIIDKGLISQIYENLLFLKRNELQNPEKAKFINSIKEILDLITKD